MIQSATLNGAQLLGLDQQIGAITEGRKADIVLIEGNPVANFKLLYGTGHMQLDRASGEVRQVGGVNRTLVDGVIYDAKALLADVKSMVAEARKAAH